MNREVGGDLGKREGGYSGRRRRDFLLWYFSSLWTHDGTIEGNITTTATATTGEKSKKKEKTTSKLVMVLDEPDGLPLLFSLSFLSLPRRFLACFDLVFRSTTPPKRSSGNPLVSYW